MRRSAAPSQLQAAKRGKFTVPYKAGHPSSQSHTGLSDAAQTVSLDSSVTSKDFETNLKTDNSASSHPVSTSSSGNSVTLEPLGHINSGQPQEIRRPSQGSMQELPLISSSTTTETSEHKPEKELLHTTCTDNFARNNSDETAPAPKMSGSSSTLRKEAPLTTEGQDVSRSPLKPMNMAKKFRSPSVTRPQTGGTKTVKNMSVNHLSSPGVKSGAEIHNTESGDQNDGVKTSYFAVVWCKLSKKKHKKWEGDAILLARGRSVSLYDMDGKEIGKGSGYKSSELESLKEDETLVIGGKEIQVMSRLTEEQYRSGKCFSGAGSVKEDNPVPRIQSQGVSKSFTNPFLGNKGGESGQMSRMTEVARQQVVAPRFDPQAPDALVMPRPSPADQWQHNKNHVQVVDVVVDPYLSVHLRPHQRDGVTFLYECVMGLRNYGGCGAILADDMGLGKTLQCITLIWTLLKQGPYGGKPPVRRVLIVTPGSLVKNWSQEFRKWLGTERLQVFVVAGDKRVEDYLKTAVYPVMVISYEMFVRGYEVVKQVPFDLIVCDEGHRLKNTAIKTTSLIMSLNTRRRIVLSGTPIQNDLQEFFSVVDFCNPGVLGSSAAFRRVYEEPILASRQPGASKQELELGEQRAAELARLTRMFVLRRTQEINNKYLPPKVELVVFCRPSPRQVEVYREILRSNVVRSCLFGRCFGTGQGAGSPHLLAIGALKQLCNHPALLANKVHAAASRDAGDSHHDAAGDLFSSLAGLYQSDGTSAVVPEDSGKLAALAVILQNVFTSCPNEKVVLVSNHTKTLDLLQQFCKDSGYSYVRLDGRTPTAQRQEIVTRFNSTFGQEKIFMLSSKAGGVGLNLVGASRLILFDIDWNPANDLQAMARVWRDGQRRRVHIYRLLTAGSIEEKVYQRQISKQGLSGAVIDFKASDIQFSQEDLKDLFSFSEDTDCETHSLLGCHCGRDGDGAMPPPPQHPEGSRLLGSHPDTSSAQVRNLSMAELLDWHHVKGSSAEIKQEWHLSGTQDTVSFLFWHETHAAKPSAQ